MSSSTTNSTAHGDAQQRVITVKTEAGDIVKYSGNPAELSGARHETRKAMRRAGAFTLLIQHNASRLRNGVICVEDLDNIPFVTHMIIDPLVNTYTFEDPCPSTQRKIELFNDFRMSNGEAPYTGIGNITQVPDRLLKLAIPNEHEVKVEALAYALTQLSIFEDEQHANELLEKCDYDGRHLAYYLDEIEAQASAEDVTLVTGQRNAFKEAGLRGLPLNFASFRAFFKSFNAYEYRCPPYQRMSDDQLSQLVGTLFIRDPTQRQNWSNHLNQPVIRSAAGVRISGPPQTFTEAKLLAEKVLRSDLVLAGIDELSSPQPALSAMHALSSLNSTSQDSSAGMTAQQLFESLLADPRKNSLGGLRSGSSTASGDTSTTAEYKPIDVPKGDDGKYIYWAPPMSKCDCGTPDDGQHIKYKWPCAYYRNPEKTDGAGSGKGKGGGGKGKGKDGGKGKGGKGKQHTAYVTEETVAAAVASALSASGKPEAPSPKAAGSVSDTSSDTQSCCVAAYESSSELAALLESTTLGADLNAFFQSPDGKVIQDFELSDGSVEIPDANSSPNSSLSVGRMKYIESAHSDTGGQRQDCSIISEFADMGKSILSRYLIDSRMNPFDSRMNPFERTDSVESCVLWDVNVSRVNMPIHTPDPMISESMNISSWIHADARSSLRGSSSHYAFQFQIDSANTVGNGEATLPESSGSTLPIFRAPVDSGCTATCTNVLDRLINVRECKEEFKSADGKISWCTAIGDMPVLAKDSTGKIFRFVFTNVRYVPDFKYTLISVKQIWHDQHIDSHFADSNELLFPSGATVPFDPRFKLCAITLISEPMLLSGLAKINTPPTKQKSENICCVGFHNVKSTAHVARLPAAQAGELLHRRCHMGVNKIRSLPHISGDAPKILSSAVPCTCVHCAAAQIRRAGHSSTMDAPDPVPGILHIDLKGPFPLSVSGKFRYAAFIIDEYSRFVFVEFLHDKSEVVDATKRVMAKFNALVGTPVDENGVALTRPTVRRLHRDHEGGLESKQFESFRANELLYSTTSAPHDHDLNPIAESTINVISTLATSYKSQSNAPIGFWPEIIRYAVDWHNSAPQASVGSSTADPQISAHQRFTLKQPKIMDLAAFGARTVVLKPPTHQSKTTLASRGWVGMFLGRSSDAIGTYEVWVPSTNRKVRSSSLTIDEEFFPWHGTDAHQPLASVTASARFISDHLGADPQINIDDSPSDFTSGSDINETPRPSLSFFNMFSGPYEREGGLSNAMRAFGWDRITDFDNHRTLGGGWEDDLLNDSRYTEVLQQATSGAFDALMCAFPCTTTTVARCFDASIDGGDPGLIPVRSAEYPDGIPGLPIKYKRELSRSNRLLDRTVEVLIAARRSPRRTTIILENPSDRSISGTAQHMADVSHGSLFATSQFKRL